MKGGENIVRKLAIRKTAGLMALIMSISLVLPIIAYAASGFSKVEYDPAQGSITGEVYVDAAVYGAKPGEKVWIKINLGSVSGVVYATYVKKEGDRYYYTFSVTDSVYMNKDRFQLDLYYGESASLGSYTVERKSGDDNTNPIAPYIPPSSVSDSGVVKANPDGTVDANALKKALESGSATVEISGEVAKLPASALLGGGVVTIVSELGSYELPLEELDLEGLAEELGVALDDLVITVSIVELQGEAKEQAEQAVQAAGGKVVSKIVDFRIEAVAGDNSTEVTKFGVFVKRSLEATEEADNIVAVRILEDGTVVPVPTKAADGKYEIYSNTNSVYALISVEPKSFSDLTNHWAAKDITTLANKLIVNGTGADKFEPGRNITRAEFAAMIVRALGLQATEAADFSDVPASAWYADEVAAAAEYGIVKGDGTGKFRPTDTITRQEMAVMVIRAQALAGKEVVLSADEIAAVLGGYSDAGQIGSWAQAELAAAIDAGIVRGTSDNTVTPNATATRAEAVAMIIRLLGNVDFI
jgi:hypothetical protein